MIPLVWLVVVIVILAVVSYFVEDRRFKTLLYGIGLVVFILWLLGVLLPFLGGGGASGIKLR